MNSGSNLGLSGKFPTPYPEVNDIVQELLGGVQQILAGQLAGMYLEGSLASGGFNLNRSDIDFAVVTTGELSEPAVQALTDLHDRLSSGASPWGKELEGAYIPLDAFRRYDPKNATHPHIQRSGRLGVEHFETDWVIHRFIIREYGITLTGPPPQTLIDPISSDELRQAMIDLFFFWWAPMVDHPDRLKQTEYQVYAFLTMCRIQFTLQHGTIASKDAAALWAQQALGEAWAALAKEAADWRNGDPFDHLEETIQLIRLTEVACRESSMDHHKG